MYNKGIRMDGEEKQKILNRLLARRVLVNDCWEFTGHSGSYGYRSIKIGGRKGKLRYVHRLSAAIFHGLDLEDPKTVVLYSCDNTSCFNPDHLSLGTSLDNIRDCIRKGRRINTRGENHPPSKLKEKDVFSLIKEVQSGMLLKDVAKKYNVAPCTVSQILHGHKWKHLNIKNTTDYRTAVGRR